MNYQQADGRRQPSAPPGPPYEHMFDPSMASSLLSSAPPTSLYNAIANAHEQASSGDHPGKARRVSISKILKNPADFSPYAAARDSRRSPFSTQEVGVAPSEVNTLVPNIPKATKSKGPTTKELRELREAKRAREEAEVAAGKKNAAAERKKEDELWNFDRFDQPNDPPNSSRPAAPRTAARAPQPEPELQQADEESDNDEEMESDEESGYTKEELEEHFTPEQRKWMIPRRRRSDEVIKAKR